MILETLPERFFNLSQSGFISRDSLVVPVHRSVLLGPPSLQQRSILLQNPAKRNVKRECDRGGHTFDGLERNRNMFPW